MAKPCKRIVLYGLCFVGTIAMLSLIGLFNIQERYNNQWNLKSAAIQNDQEYVTVAGSIIEKRHIYPYLPAHERVIYNRVAKCGSTTILNVFRTLAARNNFTFIHSEIYNVRSLNEDQEHALTKDLSKMYGPLLYDRHVGFLNFTRFGYKMPQYINVIREPGERALSSFYYNEKNRKKYKTFDECADTDIHRCINKNTMLLYFCGNEPQCKIYGRYALVRAKQNVEQYYTVLGLTEDLRSFFKLLELHYPRMFMGGSKRFKKVAPLNVNSKRPKKKIKETTRQKLRDVLQHEYEFYDFVQQRLHLAKQKAGLL